jgi:DNA-binding NtrC family response regulator
LGRLADQRGAFDAACVHLQRSVTLATDAGDLELASWSQLRLLVFMSDGGDATSPLLAELRSRIIRGGSPHLIAGLHIAAAQVEGKRGHLESASRHCRAADGLLRGYDNLWLDAYNQGALAAVSLLLWNLDAALIYARRSLKLADESGAHDVRVATLGNLGYLFFQLGDLDTAAEYFDQLVSLSPVGGEKARGAKDSLARLYLVQEHFDKSHELLDEIEESIRTPEDRAKYACRYAQLTRTALLARQDRLTDALASAELVIELADRSRDVLLRTLGLLAKAELLVRLEQSPAALEILEAVAPHLPTHPPTVYGDYEKILGLALAHAGRTTTAGSHFQRARRVYEALRSTPALLDLNRVAPSAPPAHDGPLVPDPEPGVVLATVASLMVHSGRPHLLARELIALLEHLDFVQHARILRRTDAGELEELCRMPDRHDRDAAQDVHRSFAAGEGLTIELEIRGEPDAEAVATLNALALLFVTIREIERARAEREERLTLWPIEEVPLEDGHAVVAGKMRDLIAIARRVATVNVSVLITGESGTGKEVLARAIHGFSDRSDKPFVPFNCAAVPREMLESQLFGHRRGAFTGADRDNPGVIRGARGGTLFLDEIGDLSLDLQPKLLRFLESGEICPLGESVPFTVDVRVVAATNSNLEQAVKAGRFREDLFYRLNVIRLPIPPLRERRDEIPELVHHFVSKAAAEFGRGQVRVAEDTMEQLIVHSWPGNIRQLQNELRRMVAMAEPDAVLPPAALSIPLSPRRPATGHDDQLTAPLREKLQPTLARIEREMIKVALRDNQGKVDAAARALGISRKGLYLKRQRLGL